MAKCTQCKKTIGYLDATYFVEFKSRFNPSAKPKKFYKEKPTGNNYKLRFSCPECEALLFTKYEDASEFMG